MTTTHTPGPWCVRDLPTGQRYIGPSSDGGAPSVALVLSRVNVPEERLAADARLVASAPKLLAALRGAYAELLYVLSCINKDEMPFDGDRFHATLNSCAATIAEATGEKA